MTVQHDVLGFRSSLKRFGGKHYSFTQRIIKPLSLLLSKKNPTSSNSPEVEFLRLINPHIPTTLDPWTFNPDRLPIHFIQAISEKNKKSYYLNRNEAQYILDICRKGNDWIAQVYLGREKLFNEDVFMYAEEVASPHGLTLEKCAEITASLWKERCQYIHYLQHENEKLTGEVQRQRNKRLLYRCKALLTWIKKCFK